MDKKIFTMSVTKATDLIDLHQFLIRRTRIHIKIAKISLFWSIFNRIFSVMFVEFQRDTPCLDRYIFLPFLSLFVKMYLRCKREWWFITI